MLPRKKVEKNEALLLRAIDSGAIVLSKPEPRHGEQTMRTYAISFNGNANESWAAKNLVEAFDSYEVGQIQALDAGEMLHLNDGTVVRCIEA